MATTKNSNAYILACRYARKEMFLLLMTFEFLSVKNSIVFLQVTYRNIQYRYMYRHHFHLLPRVFRISSQVIFHPFPLFLLSGRNSSTIFFKVPFPVIPHHPLASRFVMSAHPQMRFRSDTPHRLANTFQLSAYD